MRKKVLMTANSNILKNILKSKHLSEELKTKPFNTYIECIFFAFWICTLNYVH